MNTSSQFLTGALLVIGCTNSAQAQLPVFDAASLAQSVKQVTAWGTQYDQMAQ